MSTSPESDVDPGEKLRRLGLQFVKLIKADVDQWRDAAAWLLTLPACQAVRVTTDPDRYPELREKQPVLVIREIADPKTGALLPSEYVFDDEARFTRICGPTCRRLMNGWTAALHRFKERGRDRYYDFGREDFSRIGLLSALTLCRDFDGSELGLGWSWDPPSDSKVEYDGRRAAWSRVTAWHQEAFLLNSIAVAVEHHEAFRRSSERGSSRRLPSHSSDFTSVDWFGTQYTFSKGNQAQSVKVLWEAWERGNHSLSQETIGELMGSSSERFELRTTFRRRRKGGGYVMHAAWGTMIQRAEKGCYRLVPPESARIRR